MWLSFLIIAKMLPFGVLLDSVLGSQGTVRTLDQYLVLGTTKLIHQLFYYFLVTFYVRSTGTFFVHSCFVSKSRSVRMIDCIFIHWFLKLIHDPKTNKTNDSCFRKYEGASLHAMKKP